MSKQSINDTLYNEAITKLVNAGEEKITKHNSSLNNYYLDMVQATIDKGIENKLDKLKDDEKLSVKINKIMIDDKTHFKIDIVPIKKERIND
jgi:hypothetical protein